MARGLKFHIKEVEELYYLCSENKGADQLRGYHEADLRLCFRICKKLVFSRRGSHNTHLNEATVQLIRSKFLNLQTLRRIGCNYPKISARE